MMAPEVADTCVRRRRGVCVSGVSAGEVLLCGVHGVLLVARTGQGHL
jgi:hypothetical protein